MGLDFPLHRFEEFGPLSSAERAALTEIGEAPARFDRHSIIRAQGEHPLGFYLLTSGWVAASHTLRDGKRQILKVHLPGDALGTPSVCMMQTVEELFALTEATVIHVPNERLADLFETHPRLIAKFMLSIQLERVALMDRLVSIGRTSSQQRVAAFVLDMLERLEPLGLVNDGSFFLPVTQEQIADVVGLTTVHTNRALMFLGREGLIARHGSQYAVPDRDALARFAARSERKRHVQPAWLPRAR